MIPANAVPAVLALLNALDPFFRLGGQLIEEALKRAPELNVAPIPDLGEMDAARKEAVERTTEHFLQNTPTDRTP